MSFYGFPRDHCYKVGVADQNTGKEEAGMSDLICKQMRMKNNAPLYYGHVLCKLPAPFPSHSMIGLNMCMSLLISTTIILSLCPLRNYNHLLHNYNFKVLYWGASV